MSLEQSDEPGTGAHEDADDELFDNANEDGDDAEGDEEDDDGHDPEDGEGEDEEDRRARGPTEIEAIALKAGWKPKDKWKGEGWVPAEKFLENAAKRASNAKREARELQDRMDRLESAHQESLKRTIDALDAKAKQLRAQAIREAAKDPAKAEKMLEEIDEVLAEEKAKITQSQQAGELKLTPLDKKFFNENSWLIDDHDDPADDAEADEAFEMLQIELTRLAKSGMSAVRAYKEAQALLREAYPHRYHDDEDEPRRGKRPGRRAPDLSGGRRQLNDDGGGGARSLVAKLPPEAKRAAKEYVERGIYGSEEEYAEVYFQENSKDRR